MAQIPKKPIFYKKEGPFFPFKFPTSKLTARGARPVGPTRGVGPGPMPAAVETFLLAAAIVLSRAQLERLSVGKLYVELL